jgi:hypothetical protein
VGFTGLSKLAIKPWCALHDRAEFPTITLKNIEILRLCTISQSMEMQMYFNKYIFRNFEHFWLNQGKGAQQSKMPIQSYLSNKMHLKKLF